MNLGRVILKSAKILVRIFCFSIDTGLCSAALEKATQLAATSGNNQYTTDEIQTLSDLNHGENIFITKVDESWYQPDSKQTTLAGNFKASSYDFNIAWKIFA